MKEKLFSSRNFVSLIFPSACLGCEKELPSDVSEQDAGNLPVSFIYWQQSHWCSACWQKLALRTADRCPKCSAVLSKPNPYPDGCVYCHGSDLRFDHAWSVGNYQGLLQELVVRMKNQHDEALAVQLGRLLGYELLSAGWDEFDRLIAVPTHWWRKLRRAFHAADILCEVISQQLGIPSARYGVVCQRPTQKQGMLSTQGRFANVKGAFAVHPKSDFSGQRVLVVDDVMTSGATTGEVARILKRQNAAAVCVAVVARGVKGN